MAKQATTNAPVLQDLSRDEDQRGDATPQPEGVQGFVRDGKVWLCFDVPGPDDDLPLSESGKSRKAASTAGQVDLDCIGAPGLFLNLNAYVPIPKDQRQAKAKAGKPGATAAKGKGPKGSKAGPVTSTNALAGLTPEQIAALPADVLKALLAK